MFTILITYTCRIEYIMLCLLYKTFNTCLKFLIFFYIPDVSLKKETWRVGIFLPQTYRSECLLNTQKE